MKNKKAKKTQNKSKIKSSILKSTIKKSSFLPKCSKSKFPAKTKNLSDKSKSFESRLNSLEERVYYSKKNKTGNDDFDLTIKEPSFDLPRNGYSIMKIIEDDFHSNSEIENNIDRKKKIDSGHTSNKFGDLYMAQDSDEENSMLSFAIKPSSFNFENKNSQLNG